MVVETLPEILDRTREFVRREGPFFVYLHFMDVHGPDDAPETDSEAIGSRPSLDRREASPQEGFRELPSYLQGIRWFQEEELDDRTFGELIAFRLTGSHTVRVRHAANVLDFDRGIASFWNASVPHAPA